MLDALRDTAAEVTAVALWTSATTGVMALLAISALALGGWAGGALVALVPATSWCGHTMRRRAAVGTTPRWHETTTRSSTRRSGSLGVPVASPVQHAA